MKVARNPWPLAVATTFALFFCGIATVIAIAVTHREPLVSENYYDQELKFQDQIDAAARAGKSGAAITGDSARGLVIIALPVEQLTQEVSGRIELYRPSAPELDREFKLAPGTDGRQPLDLAGLAAGLWVVRVKWHAGGGDYFLEQKITVAGK